MNPQLGSPELSPSQNQPEVPVNAADRRATAAIAGELAINITADEDYVLVANDPPNETDQWHYGTLRFTDSGEVLSEARSIIYPDVDAIVGGPSRLRFMVVNATAVTLTVKRAGQPGTAVGAGQSRLMHHNGTDIQPASASGGGGSVAAEDVGYDNAVSGLFSSNVQDAIDEVEARVDDLESTGGGGGGGGAGPFSDLRRVIRACISAGSGDFTSSSGWQAGTVHGMNLLALGSTLGVPTQGTGSLAAAMIRNRSTSAASTGSSAGFRQTITDSGIYRSISGSALGGGFDVFIRFSFPTVRTDQRFFVGLFPSSSSAPSASADPSAIVNMVGIGKDEADTNLQIMANDGSGTASKVDTGVAAAGLAGKVLELWLHCEPNGAQIGYSLEIVDDDEVITGILNSNLPAQNVALFALLWVNTGGTTSTAVTLDFNRLVIATDR